MRTVMMVYRVLLSLRDLGRDATKNRHKRREGIGDRRRARLNRHDGARAETLGVRKGTPFLGHRTRIMPDGSRGDYCNRVGAYRETLHLLPAQMTFVEEPSQSACQVEL